jgi:phage baseplate assembly protein W
MKEHGKEFLGKGWAFPFLVEPDRGRIALSAYEDDVQESIRIILATSKGERMMRPDFGCGIHELVFGAINTALITRIQTDVTEALREFEPRIEVLQVAVDQQYVADGRVDVAIDYRVRTTNQSGNLVFPFYFKEGS